MSKRTFYTAIIFAVLMSVLVTKCSDQYAVNSLKEDFVSEKTFLENEKQQLMKERDLAVFDSEVQKQNLISEKKAKELIGEEAEKYKKLHSFVKAELKTVIKGIDAKYRDTVFFMIDRVLEEPEDTNMTFVPKVFHYGDEWVNIDGTVKKRSVAIDSLTMINKFDVTIGWKKDGLFKKSKPVVELKSYNPYTSVPYVNNLVVKEKQKRPFLSKAGIFFTGIIIGILIKK